MNKEVRDIRVVFLIFSAFFVFFSYKHYPSIISYVLIGFAVILLCLVAISPLTLRPLFKLWMKVGHAIGKVNTQILLTIVFILIFIPVAMVMRLIRRDSMQRRFNADDSYWKKYKFAGMSDKKRYERQF